MTEPMHRIFLAPIRVDVDARWAHQHWTSRHAEVFARTPGLRGYTQNRPLEQDWSGRSSVCAESWFDDRDAERIAFESDYYLGAVAADEALFVQRDQAWLSAVSMARRAHTVRRYRVLAFGQSVQSAADWLRSWDPHDVDVLTLNRPPPLSSRASALGLWTDDLARATDAALHFGPLVVLAQPAAVVPAPEAPWSTADAAPPDPDGS